MTDDDYSALKEAGRSFIGLLCCVLVIFKLTEVINWSWVWVFSPIWIQVLILVAHNFYYHTLKKLTDVTNNRQKPPRGQQTKR